MMFKKFLGWIPAIVFLVGMAFTAFDIWLRRLGNWFFRADLLTRRRTETSWQLRWARFYNRLIHKIMRISMPIRLDEGVCRGKPSIIILNHRTALDHLLAARVIKLLGLNDVRWVVKSQMRGAPVVGGSLDRAGHAFVLRNGNSRDKDAIRAMARLARQDGSSVALYPEGTRHDGIFRVNSRWPYLRDPKKGGLQVLMDELSDYQIIFVCLNWRGLRGGKTMWDGDGLLGIKGDVKVWRMLLTQGDDASSILERGWIAMNEHLSSGCLPARELSS